jgi:predicted porin
MNIQWEEKQTVKKNVLALCALAAARAAAQSSVTMFGDVDAGVSCYSVKSRSWGQTPPREVTQSQNVLSSSG